MWLVKRYEIVIDESCAICDSRVGKDVAHFLVFGGRFERSQQMLLDDEL